MLQHEFKLVSTILPGMMYCRAHAGGDFYSLYMKNLITVTAFVLAMVSFVSCSASEQKDSEKEVNLSLNDNIVNCMNKYIRASYDSTYTFKINDIQTDGAVHRTVKYSVFAVSDFKKVGDFTADVLFAEKEQKYQVVSSEQL